MISLIKADLVRKAQWYGLAPSAKSVLRMMFSDGSSAQIIYRFMQYCKLRHLGFLALFLYRLNARLSGATIGRGAQIGPGLVMLHSYGIVVNTSVLIGENLVIEHNVTIGAEQGLVPEIGDNVFIGTGASIIGGIKIGSNAKIGANSLVIKDVPAGATVIGVPAQIIRIDNERILPQVAVSRH